MSSSLYTPSQNQNFKNLMTTSIMVVVFLFGCFWAVSVWQEKQHIKQIVDMPEAEFQELMIAAFPVQASQNRLIAIATRALDISPPAVQTAKRAVSASLQFSKPCVLCETRWAYIDILENGKLTIIGQEALRRSYEISPYGTTDTMTWRLHVSSMYWSVLPKDLQTYGLMQITALGETPVGRNWLKKLDTNVVEIRARIALY